MKRTTYILLMIVSVFVGMLSIMGNAAADTECRPTPTCDWTATPTKTATVTATPVFTETPTLEPTQAFANPCYSEYCMYMPMFWSCKEFKWEWVGDPQYGYWAQVCEGH